MCAKPSSKYPWPYQGSSLMTFLSSSMLAFASRFWKRRSRPLFIAASTPGDVRCLEERVSSVGVATGDAFGCRDTWLELSCGQHEDELNHKTMIMSAEKL